MRPLGSHPVGNVIRNPFLVWTTLRRSGQSWHIVAFGASSRGEGVPHRGGLGLDHGLEMAAVVTHRPVPGSGDSERVAVEGCRCQPGQGLAGFGGIRASRLVRQRGPGQCPRVVVEDGDEGLRYGNGSPPAWRRRRGPRVL